MKYLQNIFTIFAFTMLLFLTSCQSESGLSPQLQKTSQEKITPDNEVCSFTISGPTYVCPGDRVWYQVIGCSNGTWNLANGKIIRRSGSNRVLIQWNKVGYGYVSFDSQTTCRDVCQLSVRVGGC